MGIAAQKKKSRRGGGALINTSVGLQITKKYLDGPLKEARAKVDANKAEKVKGHERSEARKAARKAQGATDLAAVKAIVADVNLGVEEQMKVVAPALRLLLADAGLDSTGAKSALQTR